MPPAPSAARRLAENRPIKIEQLREFRAEIEHFGEFLFNLRRPLAAPQRKEIRPELSEWLNMERSLSILPHAAHAPKLATAEDPSYRRRQ